MNTIKRLNMEQKARDKISKFLSLILRHKPETIDLSLDANGWADITELIEKCSRNGHKFTDPDLQEVVRPNDKQRFAFNEDGSKIRASQGHSIEVELELTPAAPPAQLYHGTVERFLDAIRS